MDPLRWKEGADPREAEKLGAMLSVIKRMTSRNNHTEAYIVGAKLLNAKVLAKKFGMLYELQKLEGHMPNDLGKYQYGLYEQMLRFAKQQLSSEGYRAFYDAF